MIVANDRFILAIGTPGIKCKISSISFPDHNDDIGVECYGIEFSSSDKPSSIQYAEVSRAYEAIKGSEFLPDLEHVTIKSSVYGVVSDNASSPLAIKDSSISDNLFAGIQINSRSKNITIKNTVVNNTMKGHGLQYREILPGPVDVCSADVTTITTFPVIFQASGKPGMSVDCSKVRYVS